MFVAALFLFQATFQNPRVRESSGVAVSREHRGVVWTHNDSGDGAYLYATDLQGRDFGFLLVPGARAVDWEDMSLGPCPVVFRPARASSCIYLADTGDNREGRASVTVYAVPEPRPPQGPGDTLRTTSAPAVLTLRYPDGAHDVEAVYVSPRDTALYLVSKGRTPHIRVYRVPRSVWPKPGESGDVAVASLLQTLDILPDMEAGRVITGASARPDGRRVALRTYSEIYLFYPGVGGRLTPVGERACSVAGFETGGEAIDFVNDSTFVITSEADRGHPGTIQTVLCRF